MPEPIASSLPARSCGAMILDTKTLQMRESMPEEEPAWNVG